MADIVSPLDVSPITSSASSSKAIAAVDHDDEFEDACSICLEPFNLQDPPTVTNCRHEYHLQCILEWSQRSKECPICWQLLVLKDPASQELLVAVENERNLRSRRSVRRIRDDYEIIHDNSYEDDSDFEERIMRHFAAAAARRASYISRRGRQRTSDIGPSQGFPSIIPGALSESDMQHTHTSPEHQRCSYESSEGDSPTFGSPSVVHAQHPSPTVPEVLIMEPNSVTNGDSCNKPSHHLPESPQRPSSSEIFAFSESIKSKFSAASSRYKESISKGTRGFKEKLLARNISVKELGRGVQREMNAGIAGVARMIDRLDLASKRTEVSVPTFSCTRGTSNLSSERNDMQGSVLAQQETDNRGENSHVISSAASSHVHSTISSKLEAPIIEGGN